MMYVLRRMRSSLFTRIAVAIVLAIAAMMQLAVYTGAAEVSTFTVNSTGDETDANSGDGVCATSQGACTLRAAIQETNLHRGADTIAFNIPGTGVKTITLSASLPAISDKTGPTTIDGYTQPGSSPNTDPLRSNADIAVQITSPGNFTGGIYGLKITSPGNVVRGLALFKIESPVELNGTSAHHNTIAGNFLGTDAAGNFAATSQHTLGDGIYIRASATNNTVGGTSPADRNVISGNARRGVTIKGDYNVVINNIVGLGPAGNKRLANIRHGVDLNADAAHNRVGGTQPGERNVISGNLWEGVEFSHGVTVEGNEVVGNFIGTDPTGENGPDYAANEKWGVHIEDDVRNNVVASNVIGNNGSSVSYGGVRVHNGVAGTVIRENHIGISLGGRSIPNTTRGVQIDGQTGLPSFDTRVADNVIANNLIVGVRVTGAGSDRNTITRNSIFDNGRFGIDLDPLGQLNPNDADDADSGPNQQLNFPVLQAATPQNVTGTACGNCTVEVFLADGGAGENPQGKTFVGSSVAEVNGKFTVTVSGVAAGSYVTATATDQAGNTSEFSPNKAVS